MILIGPFQLSMFYDSMLKDVNLCCAVPQRYFKIETSKLNPLPWQRQTERSGCVCQRVKPYTLKVRHATAYPPASRSTLLQAPSLGKLFPSRSQPPAVRDGAHHRSSLTISQIFGAVAGGSSHRLCREGATGPHAGTRYSQHNAALGFAFFFHRARVQNSNSSTLRWPLPWRHPQGRGGSELLLDLLW